MEIASDRSALLSNLEVYQKSCRSKKNADTEDDTADAAEFDILVTTEKDGAEVRLAALNDRSSSSNSERSLIHRQSAEARKAAILDLMWDPDKLAFYDFNLTGNARSGFFSAAAFYPMWNDI
ncbi:hypothetical protein M407DRAFT_27465 [Tulasnella calospora MUT 4182]|uniref:alpha,alpha-trehalase n=1 Tax=Tulasnella calospora MUT 4182 TaxID=1051891 RepID=A0A0C3LNQ7_9AGAM|nr:hypothetical protein M407DRAFT_27465 [Tulasnella calospora MUT 4182]